MQRGSKPKCYNRPDYKRGRMVQDGWTAGGTRKMVYMPHRMSVECQQWGDLGEARLQGWDCLGCKHYKGE